MENNREKQREAKKMRADRVRAKTERKNREKEMEQNRAIIQRTDELLDRGRKRKLDEVVGNSCAQSGTSETAIELMDYEQSSNGDSGEGQTSVIEGEGPSTAMLPIALAPIIENDRFEELQRQALELMHANPVPPAYPMSFLQGMADQLGLEKFVNSGNIEKFEKLMSEIREHIEGLKMRNHVIDTELTGAATGGIYPKITVLFPTATPTRTISFEELD